MTQHRSINEIITEIFKDGQAANSITEEDLRDAFITALQHPQGSLYVDTPAETTINTPGTYEKVAGGTVSNHLNLVDMPVDNRLRYIGTIVKHFHVAGTVNLTSAGANVDVGLAIYHWDDSASSGSIQIGSIIVEKMGIAGDKNSAAIHWDLEMEPNDYVELYVTNLDGTQGVTAQFYMHIEGSPM